MVRGTGLGGGESCPRHLTGRHGPWFLSCIREESLLCEDRQTDRQGFMATSPHSEETEHGALHRYSRLRVRGGTESFPEVWGPVWHSNHVVTGWAVQWRPLSVEQGATVRWVTGHDIMRRRALGGWDEIAYSISSDRTEVAQMTVKETEYKVWWLKVSQSTCAIFLAVGRSGGAPPKTAGCPHWSLVSFLLSLPQNGMWYRYTRMGE